MAKARPDVIAMLRGARRRTSDIHGQSTRPLTLDPLSVHHPPVGAHL
jgi:hypothetical protein